MPYIRCECGGDFFREPHEAWKTRCIPCWRESQDPDAPHRVRNLEQALLWAEGELGRRQDLRLAFQVHISVMVAALKRLGDPDSRRCRLWLLELLIPEDGHFEPGLSLAIDRAHVAVEGAP
jgi:hypothetical protein